MTARDRQSGFTIIELMVAGTVGLMLMIIVTTIYFDAVHTADILLRQISLNRAAREMFDILALGGKKDNVNGTGTTTSHGYVFGLRGRSANSLTPAKAEPGSLTTDPSDGTLNDPALWFDSSSANSYPGSAYWAVPTSNNSATPSFLMARDSSNPSIYLYRLSLMPINWRPLGPPTWALSSEAIPEVSIKCTGTDDPVRNCTSSSTVIMKGYLKDDPFMFGTGKLRPIVLNLVNPYSLKDSETKKVNISDLSTVYWTAFTLNVD